MLLLHCMMTLEVVLIGVDLWEWWLIIIKVLLLSLVSYEHVLTLHGRPLAHFGCNLCVNWLWFHCSGAGHFIATCRQFRIRGASTSLWCPWMIKWVSHHQIVFSFFSWWSDFLLAINHALGVRCRRCVVLSWVLQGHLSLYWLYIATFFVARCVLVLHRLLFIFDGMVLFSGTVWSAFDLSSWLGSFGPYHNICDLNVLLQRLVQLYAISRIYRFIHCLLALLTRSSGILHHSWYTI